MQLERFHFLHPMFWYLLLGMALIIITNKWKIGKFISVAILIFQLGFIVKYHEILVNKNGPTFREFYDKDLFEEIKQTINKPLNTYKVISIGIHPAIAHYNGFYCLDGYCADYSLQHKHDFRKIISKELDKDSELKNYFDNWGSRCYAFSSEIKQDYLNPNPLPISNLGFDYEFLKEMGGDYIFSSAEIKNNQKIELLKVFKNEESFWEIYVYKVN